MNILLTVIDGRMKGRKYPILEGRTLTIGRGSGADVVIMDAMASRIHCSVTNSGNEFVLKDLKSSNGTFKDTFAVKEEKLCSGDRFRIGTTTFEIRGLAAAQLEKVLEEPDEPVVVVEKSGIGKTQIMRNPARTNTEDGKMTKVMRRPAPSTETKNLTLGDFESIVGSVESDDDGEDMPPITVIASGKNTTTAEAPKPEADAVQPDEDSDEFAPVEVLEQGTQSMEKSQAVTVMKPSETDAAIAAFERELDDDFAPVEVLEPGTQSMDKSQASAGKKPSETDAVIAAFERELESFKAHRPSELETDDALEATLPPSIEVKTTFAEYGKESHDPKLDSEFMPSPETVTEDSGLVMVAPGKLRNDAPSEFQQALDAIPDEDPDPKAIEEEPPEEEDDEPVLAVMPTAESEEEIVEEEEPFEFDPIPKSFQSETSEEGNEDEVEELVTLDEVEELEELEVLEEIEEVDDQAIAEPEPASGRMTVEFRRTVEDSDEGGDDSALAILEAVPGFDYDDDLLCIKCGDMMEREDIDSGRAAKEGYGYKCPKCVISEQQGQISGLGFGNLQAIDLGTIDDELLEELERDKADISEMFDQE